tara:strand:- start:8387 stop:8689 length:303 start_codon:yes stop_codon:yes gene_type:complete
MKLTVKLNKEQAEGFKAFQQNVKPEEIGDEEFLKLVFFNGIQRMNEQLYEIAQKYLDEEKENLAASGVNIIDDGEQLSMVPPKKNTMSASSVITEDSDEN